jgi:hypothetical protein
MGVSAYVAGPIAILGIMALLSTLGLGAGGGSFGNIEFNSGVDLNGSPIVYYDALGSPTAYYNGSSYRPGEIGRIRDLINNKDLAFWGNLSGNFQLYKDAAATQQLKLSELSPVLTGESSSAAGGFSVSLGTTLGILAIISGIVAVGVIASVRFFGFGLSETGINTLMKGGAYIIAFSIFSGLAMNLIVESADYFTP